MASDVALVTGDGSKLVSEIVANLSHHEAARTMVIFDGEKRFGAYPTWRKVQPNPTRTQTFTLTLTLTQRVHFWLKGEATCGPSHL